MRANAIEKIEECDYQCEAGPLVMNQDWVDLKERIARFGEEASLECLVKDHHALADAVHGILGRVSMLEVRLVALEKQWRLPAGVDQVNRKLAEVAAEQRKAEGGE